MGNCQLMGWNANIDMCIVENQILDIDKFARHPHAGCRIEEMTALDEALTGRTAPHGLVQPRELVFCCRFHFPISIGRKPAFAVSAVPLAPFARCRERRCSEPLRASTHDDFRAYA